MNYKLIMEIARTRLITIVSVVALLLINACLYAYLSLYQGPRLESLQSNWFAKRQSTGAMTVMDAATIYSQGTRDLKTWLARIYPKKDFTRFLGELFETAANNNLAVKNVVYKPDLIKEEGLIAYTIGFTVSGNYAAIKSFISDIARSRQIIVIDTLSLSNSSTIQESPELKLQITTYLRTEGGA
jgi:type IV pilus assembly protein PilO